MSKEEILNSSREFLLGIFKQYSKRACENLGVSPENNDEEEYEGSTQLRESDYPTEFKKLSNRSREEIISEYGDTDEFLKKFSEYNPNKFNKR